VLFKLQLRCANQKPDLSQRDGAASTFPTSSSTMGCPACVHLNVNTYLLLFFESGNRKYCVTRESVAARGFGISNVNPVFHYELPNVSDVAQLQNCPLDGVRLSLLLELGESSLLSESGETALRV